MNKKTVLIIGMHRSGTSAITAGLSQALGVKLGDIANPIGEQNKKGFFENFVVVRFNDKVLKSFGAGWDTYGSGKAIDWSDDSFKALKEEASGLLKKYYNDYEIWGLKDPRISIVLPFWKSVLREFDSSPHQIIALRHPLEIAFSQKVRKEKSSKLSLSHICGEDLRYTLNLWFWYNIKLLNDLPDDNNIVVMFENILADPEKEMGRIGRLLGIEPDAEGLKNYGESFLEKQLKHHSVSDAEVEPYMHEYSHVFELYNRMKSYAEKDRLLREDISEILSGMPDSQILNSWTAPIYSYIDTLREKLTEKNSQLIECREYLNDSGPRRLAASVRSNIAMMLRLIKNTCCNLIGKNSSTK